MQYPPYAALAKSAHNAALSVAESTQLDNWLTELEEKHERIDINFLHLFCTVVSAYSPTGFVKHAHAHARSLEYLIHQKCPHVFAQPSLAYIAWRDRLSSGSPVSMNGAIPVLGRELLKTKEWAAFEIEGDPHHLIWFGKNPVIIALYQQFCKSNARPIPFANIVEIAQEDGSAKVKRLVPLTTRFPVQKEFSDKEKTQYREVAKSISDLTDHIGKEVCFSTDHVLCDAKTGELGLSLTSLSTPHLKRLLKFEDVETIIWKVAGKVQAVCHLLRNNSGLLKHNISHFYETIVTEIAQNSTYDEEKTRKLINKRKLKDFCLDQRAVAFTGRVKEIFQRSMELLADTKSKESDPKEKEDPKTAEYRAAISKIILQYIQSFGTVSLFVAEDQKNDLISTIAKEALAPLQEEPLQEEPPKTNLILRTARSFIASVTGFLV